MKKRTYLTLGVMFLFAVVAAIFDAGMFEITSLTDLLEVVTGVGSGITYAFAGAAVEGEAVSVEQVKDKSPDLDEDYVSKRITEMKPASTPLDTIMRSVGRTEKIDAFRTEYYSVDTKPFTDTVSTAYTKPGTGLELANVEVSNVSAWSVDDTCFVDGVNGSDGHPLMLFVASVDNAANTIGVQAPNGPVESTFPVVPTIPLNSTLVRMGNAKSEKDVQTDPYAMLPTKEYNYVQLFMAQIEETTYQRMHAQEVNWGFSDYERLNIYDLRARMEFSYLFGYRAKFTDKVGKDEKYTTGGVTRYIDKYIEYGTNNTDTTIKQTDFINWTKKIFTGNNGSDRRVMFMGSDLMQYISQIDTIQKQIDAKKTETLWGITWRQIETNFGSLLLKYHPLLDFAGWSKNAIVLDVNNVEKHVFLPTTVTDLDLKKSGQRNVDATVIAETSGPVLRYPDTHAVIRQNPANP